METYKDRLIIRPAPWLACTRRISLGTIGAAGGEGAMASIWSETGRLPLAGLTVIDFG